MSLQGIFSAIAWPESDLHSSLRSVLERVRNAALTRSLLRYRVWFIALFQAVLIWVGFLAAWLLRFNFVLPGPRLLLTFVPILLALRLTAIYRFGLLHGWWRFTGINDAVAVVEATLAGSIAFVFYVRFILGITSFPLAVYFLEPLISIFLLAGVRVLSRVLAESLQTKTHPSEKVILIGAGAAARATLRELSLPGIGYRAIGCVDDDPSKARIRLDGVPVLGSINRLPALAEKYGVSEVLIAIPSATPDQMQRIVKVCEKAQLRFKTIPSFRGILHGWIDFLPFQEMLMENLLGRDQVEIDLDSVRKQIEGQAILVTGAAGTIGSELCRQALQFRPAKLICLDRNETAMFYLQLELRARAAGTTLVFCVTDFGDGERMSTIFADHRPSVIFHAAAYKHVPIMESNVYDAVKNNVFGLHQLLEIAEKSGCPSFVLISSDKAVNPVNIMGATKRIGERMISCRPAGGMRCVSVRFGNVLGSNGSVVRILQEQLRDHRPLTITHPEVSRFFMTTREAVSLVLQACAMGNHGDTLILEMGSPIRILDLAKKLIQLSGKSEREVVFQFTGLREGEKLFEELSYATEKILPTSSPKIGRIRGTPFGWPELNRQLQGLRKTLSAGSEAAIRDAMKEIVSTDSPRESGGSDRASADPIPISTDAAPQIFHPFIQPKRDLIPQS
jgi:FlaA1/EpsC-like NDP-sugar epimerase